MEQVEIVRKTKSICPVCLRYLDASVINKGKQIVLLKNCDLHGQYEVLLSQTPTYYKKLDKFYFSVMSDVNSLLEYEMWPTIRCNMVCPICCFGKNRGKMETTEPSIIEIENFVKKHKHRFYILSGGEPTCREDINIIIECLKKYRKTVTINTNGLKLIDIAYIRNLQQSGLDRVNLQFDGFNKETYRILRGDDLLDKKLIVLENLKKLNFSTTINAVIARKINDNEINEFIDFAVKNDFINGINFFTICYLGEVKHWSLEHYLMPDELIDILEVKTNYKITKKSVFLFQKLHLAIKSFFKQKYCFYNQVYLLIRKKGGYEPIGNFLNLAKAEIWIDRYEKVFRRSKIISTLYLIAAFISLLSNIRVLFVIWEFYLLGLSYFFKTSHYVKNRRFFSLSFSTGCDPYKIDYAIVQNCQNEIISVGDKTGKLEFHGRDGLYCIDIERKYLCL